MSDLVKRLRSWKLIRFEDRTDALREAADEIESLQARIEVLEGERARRIKEMGELESMLDLDPTYHDMKRGFDKAQARIEQLKQTSEYWKAEHLAGNQRIAELESGISEVLQTWPPSGERVTLQLLLNPNMMAPQPPEER